jgi:hypothetical protein
VAVCASASSARGALRAIPHLLSSLASSLGRALAAADVAPRRTGALAVEVGSGPRASHQDRFVTALAQS